MKSRNFIYSRKLTSDFNSSFRKLKLEFSRPLRRRGATDDASSGREFPTWPVYTCHLALLIEINGPGIHSSYTVQHKSPWLYTGGQCYHFWQRASDQWVLMVKSLSSMAQTGSWRFAHLSHMDHLFFLLFSSYKYVIVRIKETYAACTSRAIRNKQTKKAFI